MKKCVICGKEESFDFYSSLEENSYYCDECARTNEKQEIKSDSEELSAIKGYRMG